MPDIPKLLSDCRDIICWYGRDSGQLHFAPGDRRSLEERLDEAIGFCKRIDPETQTLIKWLRKESENSTMLDCPVQAGLFARAATCMELLAVAQQGEQKP